MSPTVILAGWFGDAPTMHDWLQRLGIDPMIAVLTEATCTTVLLTLLAMPAAVVLGLALAMCRRSPRRWLSGPAWGYIEFIRGTPLLVQMFFVYYTLPQIDVFLHDHHGFTERYFTYDNFTVGVICLALNYAAYQAEILRAGLEAVDKSQREAGLAIGMSEWQAFRVVVMPQAFRIAVPAIINDAIAMLKDSSLVSTIGVFDLLNRAMAIGKARVNVPEMLMIAAVIYLCLSLMVALLGRWVEHWLKVEHQAETPIETLRRSHRH